MPSPNGPLKIRPVGVRCGDAKTAEGALLRDVVGPPQSMETLDLHSVAIARRLGNLDQRRSISSWPAQHVVAQHLALAQIEACD